MKHVFIPFETGIPKLAKEMGFNVHCFGHYTKDNKLHLYNNVEYNGGLSNKRLHEGEYAAPLYQDIIFWLFSKFQIEVKVKIYSNTYGEENFYVVHPYAFNYYTNKKYPIKEPSSYNDLGFKLYYNEIQFTEEYNQLLNTAIKEGFKLIKTK